MNQTLGHRTGLSAAGIRGEKNESEFQKGNLLSILQHCWWNSPHFPAKIHLHKETEVLRVPGDLCGEAVTASQTLASASRLCCIRPPEIKGGSRPTSCWQEEDTYLFKFII